MRDGRWRVMAVLAAGTLVASCTGSAVRTPGTSARRVITTAGTSAPATSPIPQRSATSASTAPPSHPARRSATAAALHLPLEFHTGSARQVVTVTAASTSSTEGTLHAWRRVPGGWRPAGAAVHAWLGSEGLTTHPSETRSATPIGSFTLTRAFGREPDPGTALPYVQTTPADWWISEPGLLYNTRQRCATDCPFTLGDPNEHLYYTVPYYRYAVVIDYNTRNAPGGVVQGAGSAFFLHVSVGAPTAGCVSISEAQLVRIMRWLSPRAEPRIVIGVR